jgi:flavin-dependent dehydrogenase
VSHEPRARALAAMDFGAKPPHSTCVRSESCEVAVIGGGPAGSTAGNLLARQGRKVVVLERDAFPRFHIGESLLPGSTGLLERLGVREAVVRLGSVEKHGVRFVTGDGSFSTTIYFDRTFEPSPALTYQVVRAEFDQVLLEQCARRGADVRQRQEAVAAERVAGQWYIRVRSAGGEGETGGPEATEHAGVPDEYELVCPYLVDASGRETFLAQRNRSKRMAEAHRRVAVYAHYRGVKRDGGRDEGNTVVVTVDGGWFWVIPLARGVDSIGLVIDGAIYRDSGLSPEAALAHAMAACPEMQRRAGDAVQLSIVRTTSNYSYFTSAPTGDGYVVAGDAYAFLDPIFSTGVWLAMLGGEQAAEAIGRCLDEPARARRTLSRHARSVERANSRFWRFVDSYYRPEFLDVLMRPTDVLDLRAAVTSVLAGTPAESLGMRARLALFFLIVRLQRWLPLQPRLPRCRVLAPAD